MTIYTLNLVKDKFNDDVEAIALCSSKEKAAEMAVEYASDGLMLEYDGQADDIKKAIVEEYEYHYDNLCFSIYASELDEFID